MSFFLAISKRQKQLPLLLLFVLSMPTKQVYSQNVEPSNPVPAQLFTPPTLNVAPQKYPAINPTYNTQLPTPTNSPSRQGISPEQEQDLMGMPIYRKYRMKLEATKYYRTAYAEMAAMDPNDFSITRAEYLVEDAYLNGVIPFWVFLKDVRERATQVKQILLAQGITTRNDLSLNYGIQQLYKHSNLYKDSATGKSITVPPFTYDLYDYRGEKDYTKLFVTKLLVTGSGQCHSMPLAYLMIAEQLGTKAWLSLSPEHSFIRFIDGQGRLQNFETTNGHVVTTAWVVSSGFVNAEALMKRTYLDTLSKRQLYAQCLDDLLLGYLTRFGQDDFSNRLEARILAIDPTNLTIHLIKANEITSNSLKIIKASGCPNAQSLPQYPKALQAWQDMQDAYSQIDNLGFQEMPAEAYQYWLKSIETEKKHRADQQLQQNMQQQISHLKKQKPSLTLHNN
jgi:hypothetical protein